jgi:hypothetical protein
MLDDFAVVAPLDALDCSGVATEVVMVVLFDVGTMLLL